jgi:pyridoxamine 5'-phosphate oxidase
VDPLEQIREWYAGAVAAGLAEPEAMALATVAADGAPSVRIVLLKGIDATGLRFFTNYEGRKGRELAHDPRAAVTLFWQPLARQVRVEGTVEVLEPEASDAYYASRGRASRIGAWASPQSQVIGDRAELERRVSEVEARFADEPDPPRPPFWGGFRLVPHTVEFWQGRDARLHDRERFTRTPDGWRAERLAP